MKTLLLVLILTGLTIANVVHADEVSVFHTFTDTQGRTITAQIIDIDFMARTILLQREDGVEAWIGVDELTDEDYGYIEAWHASYALLSSASFQISVQQHETATSTVRNDDTITHTTPHSAEITLQNLSEEAIDNLRIEYCYYIGDIGSGNSNPVDQAVIDAAHTESGSIVIGSLKAGENIVVNTENVGLNTIYEQREESSVFGTSVTEVLKQQDHVLILSLQVYGSGSTGILSVREYRTPEVMIAGI